MRCCCFWLWCMVFYLVVDPVTSRDVVVLDVNGDGILAASDDQDDDWKETDDDPWNVITKFIQTNLLTFDQNNNEKAIKPPPQFPDVIQEGWNQLLQNLGSVSNPFTTTTTSNRNDDGGKDDASSSHHQNHHHRYDALTELIESVSSTTNRPYHYRKQLSIPDMIDLFWDTVQSVQKQLEGTFKSVLDMILPIVNPFKLFYYMLEQEMIHNAVLKRREHAFFPEVSVDTAIQLSEGLFVAKLAYVDDCTKIQEYLTSFHNNSWILINCTTQAQPFQPAHFLAIRNDQSTDGTKRNFPMHYMGRRSSDTTTASSWTTMLWENIRDTLNLTLDRPMELEAMLVICGTKDFADMMSDALLEPTPYGNATHAGLAHSGIFKSAQYIHSTYRDFLENLLQKSKRSKLKLWLIGHSLGGGTAALACLEFNKPYHQYANNTTSSSNSTSTGAIGAASIDAYSLGFGTPAVLSLEYSEDARSKVTTIINDADCVPRMSGATLVNFLLNVSASNHWISEAQIDVQILNRMLKEKSPFPATLVDSVMSTIMNWIATSDVVNETMKAALAEKVATPVLFPPGECIHFYRDTTSWQGVYYPCRNFNALEGVRYMVDDHLIPTGYYRGLLGYIRGLKNDLNWQFQPDSAEIPDSS